MSSQLPYPGRYESHNSWIGRCNEWSNGRKYWNQELNYRFTEAKSGKHGKIAVFREGEVWGLAAKGSRAINRLRDFFGLPSEFSYVATAENGKPFRLQLLKNANGCSGMYARDDAKIPFSSRMELTLFLLTCKGVLAKRLLGEVREKK